MFEDLANYGIVPNKTYITNKLYLEKIPEQFQRAYIRGLFDGDGGISFTGNTNEVSCDFTSYFYETVEENIIKEINVDGGTKVWQKVFKNDVLIDANITVPSEDGFALNFDIVFANSINLV